MIEWYHLAKTNRGEGYQTHVIGVEPGRVFNAAVAKSAQCHSKNHQAYGNAQPAKGAVQVTQSILPHRFQIRIPNEPVAEPHEI